MKICEDLRRAVLQAAIQGKLTEQKADDGTAEDLLKEIRKEKAKLIAEGKIKKEKALPPIKDDEIPFDVPDNWVWVRLGDVIIKDIGGGTPTKTVKEYWEGNIAWMSVKDFSRAKNGFINDTLDHISQKGIDESSTSLIMPGAIIICMRMGLGKYARLNIPTAINQDLRAIWLSDRISEDYFLYFYSSLKIEGTGTTVKGIKREELFNFLIPLPPLAEQHRIVEHVDTLMSKIDELEKIENELEAMKKNFPGDLRDALLQAAIQGKLTEHRAEDGTAEDLLKEIRKEKAKLIADGKIKREKVLPPIKDDEKPFDIPDNWIWCSFGNIISLISGVDLSPDNYNSNGNGVVYITGASNIVNGSLIVNRWTTSPKKIAKRGDILFTCKGTVGSVCILEIDEAHIARQIMAIRPLKVDIKFVLYYLQYEVNIIKKQAKSMIPGIERKNINNALFPLPPLAEQHRIVERLNELLPLCEAMKGQEE